MCMIKLHKIGSPLFVYVVILTLMHSAPEPVSIVGNLNRGSFEVAPVHMLLKIPHQCLMTFFLMANSENGNGAVLMIRLCIRAVEQALQNETCTIYQRSYKLLNTSKPCKISANKSGEYVNRILHQEI